MPLSSDTIVAEGALRAAWDRVADHPDSPGVDGVTIAAFRGEVDVHIEMLRADLLAESFVPHPLRVVPLPRPDGRTRPIVIACVRDRIVHHAIATALTPVVEPVLHDDCFAYRPGRSALGALDRIESRIRDGASWVARCDIADFFDNVDHGLLGGLLTSIGVDERA